MIRLFTTAAACCLACTHSAKPNALSTASARTDVSPPIDRLFIFVRDWPREFVDLTLIRDAGTSRVTLARAVGNGRSRIVLDSVGAKDEEMVVAMLDSFDIWAMNAPDAAGAACRTRNGNRSCSITFNDYSVVMRVESGGEVRVQRYTGLEWNKSSRSVRALGDFVLAWAREREGGRLPLLP